MPRRLLRYAGPRRCVMLTGITVAVIFLALTTMSPPATGSEALNSSAPGVIALTVAPDSALIHCVRIQVRTGFRLPQ